MIKLPFYAKVAMILFGLALCLLFMWEGRTILIPLFFAFLFSILLHPVAAFLERRRFPRSLAAIMTILCFLLLLLGLFYFFGRQVSKLVHDLPRLRTMAETKLLDIQNWINLKFHIANTDQSEYLHRSTTGMLNAMVNSAATTFVGIAEGIILFIFFFIFTFFILYHRRLLMAFVLALFDEEHNHRVRGIVFNIRSLINRYILGLMMEMLVLVILIYITLVLFGIKYALLISVMAAVLNIIPYFGIYLSAAIGMIITLASGSGEQAVTLAIVFLVAHFLDANIILPRIVGGQVKMNPFITILAVLVGHLIWGIPGMFLFIPLTAIIRLISEEVPAMKPWTILLSEEKRIKILPLPLKPPESGSMEP